jgi:hypothetical protein
VVARKSGKSGGARVEGDKGIKVDTFPTVSSDVQKFLEIRHSKAIKATANGGNSAEIRTRKSICDKKRDNSDEGTSSSMQIPTIKISIPSARDGKLRLKGERGEVVDENCDYISTYRQSVQGDVQRILLANQAGEPGTEAKGVKMRYLNESLPKHLTKGQLSFSNASEPPKREVAPKPAIASHGRGTTESETTARIFDAAMMADQSDVSLSRLGGVSATSENLSIDHQSRQQTRHDSENSTKVIAPVDQWPVKHNAVVEGDLLLGGLMMVHEREDTVTCGPVMPQGGIQALEAMLYTLDRLNEPEIVPGVKVGAHILDDCDKDTYGLEMAVDFIKGEFLLIYRPPPSPPPTHTHSPTSPRQNSLQGSYD